MKYEIAMLLQHIALAITGARRDTNRDKIYEELGWESLHNRRYFRRLTQFYKIMNGITPQYLVDFVPLLQPHLYGTNVIKCLNDIGPEMRNAKSLSGGGD